MGTLKEELERIGYKSSEQDRKESDQYPKIDVRDPVVMKDYENDIKTKVKALYRRSKTSFAFKRQSGKCKEIKMKNINTDSKWYRILQTLYANDVPKSIVEMTDITGLNKSSVGTYLAKFAEFGVATKATMDGIKKYTRMEIDPAVASQLFVDRIYSKENKKPREKKIAVVAESPGLKEEPKTFQGLGPAIVDQIAQKVGEQIAQKIIVEVMGKIEIVFKLG